MIRLCREASSLCTTLESYVYPGTDDSVPSKIPVDISLSLSPAAHEYTGFVTELESYILLEDVPSMIGMVADADRDKAFSSHQAFSPIKINARGPGQTGSERGDFMPLLEQLSTQVQQLQLQLQLQQPQRQQQQQQQQQGQQGQQQRRQDDSDHEQRRNETQEIQHQLQTQLLAQLQQLQLQQQQQQQQSTTQQQQQSTTQQQQDPGPTMHQLVSASNASNASNATTYRADTSGSPTAASPDADARPSPGTRTTLASGKLNLESPGFFSSAYGSSPAPTAPTAPTVPGAETDAKAAVRRNISAENERDPWTPIISPAEQRIQAADEAYRHIQVKKFASPPRHRTPLVAPPKCKLRRDSSAAGAGRGMSYRNLSFMASSKGEQAPMGEQWSSLGAGQQQSTTQQQQQQQQQQQLAGVAGTMARTEDERLERRRKKKEKKEKRREREKHKARRHSTGSSPSGEHDERGGSSRRNSKMGEASLSSLAYTPSGAGDSERGREGEEEDEDVPGSFQRVPVVLELR